MELKTLYWSCLCDDRPYDELNTHFSALNPLEVSAITLHDEEVNLRAYIDIQAGTFEIPDGCFRIVATMEADDELHGVNMEAVQFKQARVTLMSVVGSQEGSVLSYNIGSKVDYHCGTLSYIISISDAGYALRVIGNTNMPIHLMIMHTDGRRVMLPVLDPGPINKKYKISNEDGLTINP